MRVIYIIITISLIIFIISSYSYIKDFLEREKSRKWNNELMENAIIEENLQKSFEVDWQKIKNINQDIIGWIRIEKTNINYPILHDDNNLNYLNHSFNGEYNSNGSIFTLDRNPFMIEETTIYGHNMKNKSMFSELEKYMSEDFLKAHNTFELYTKNQNYSARIFSCYSTNVYEEQKNTALLEFREKIEYYKKKSKHHVENIGEVKKIIKLSTCSYLNNHTNPTSERYYIIATIEPFK